MVHRTFESISTEAGTAHWCCAIGFLTALSFVLMWISIVMPHAPYLKYDPADVPALMGACAMGPAAGVLVVVLRNLLRFVLVNPDCIGLLMNCIASGSFVWVSGWLYGKSLTKWGAVLAIVCGAATTGVLMVGVNYLALPFYLGLPSDQLAPILMRTILPFNLAKGLANGVLVFLLYKRLSIRLPRSRHPAFPSGSDGEPLYP